jgi:hypothetical protein
MRNEDEEMYEKMRKFWRKSIGIPLKQIGLHIDLQNNSEPSAGEGGMRRRNEGMREMRNEEGNI